MSRILQGGSPSGNPHSSSIDDQSTSDWVDSYRRSEWLNDDFNSRVDLETGEIKPLKIDPDFTNKCKRKRAVYDRNEALLHRYLATDPGVLLKRLYLADESEKRSKAFDDVLNINGLIAKKPKPVSGCSGLEYLDGWSDARMVSEVIIGEQDVQIKSTLRGGRPQVGGGVRGAIVEWSKKSRSRCERHIRNVQEGSIKAFLTLTYPKVFTNDGKAVKRDLATMVKRLKRMGVGTGIWFLEFQKRGAPHIHAFLGQFPVCGAAAVARAWYEIVGSGDEKHLDWHLGKLSGRPCVEIMRNQHAASYYAVKYAVKSDQKDVPKEYQNVGRFWGCWGGLRPSYRVYYARGSDMCMAAVRMIRLWKMTKFGGFVGEGLTLYSATLRGCKPDELDQLFQYSGWCPDG